MAINQTKNVRKQNGKLNVATINICGLSQRSKMVLNQYAYTENLDALAVQETDTNLKENLELDNMYGIFDTNNAANKGAALYINNKHSITKLECISKKSKNLDSCWGLLYAYKRRYIIGSIYVKLNHKPAIGEVMKMLRVAETKKVELKASGIILLGDFNARHIFWGDKQINYYGKCLAESIDSTKFSISTANTPTFLCKNGSSYIDLSIISHELAEDMSCRTDQDVELFSGAPLRGHVPLLISFSIQRTHEPSKVVEKLDLSTMKWNEWTNHIENSIENLEQLSETENPYELWIHLNQNITQATDLYCATKRSCSHSKPYWTYKLNTLLEKLKSAKKNYLKRNTDYNLHILTEARAEFDEERKAACSNFLIDTARQLNSVQAQKFWKDFNKLFKKKTAQKIDPLFDENHTLLTKSDEIDSCLFSVFFEAKHLKDQDFDQAFYEEVNNIYTRIMNEELWEENDEYVNKLNSTITKQELLKAIKCTAKSIDNFNFHQSMLKHLGNSALDMLVKIFNLTLKSHTWIWQSAEVIFLRKDGKDSYSKPGNYRPICITSYIGKLLEAIISRRLEIYLQETNQIDPNQEGFSRSRNTIRYLNHLHLGILADKEKNLSILCLFIDFEKAFDSVWKRGLIIKLNKLGISGDVLHLIDSFLFTRKVKLNINGNIGEERQCAEYGLPQGSVMSPVLFKIYLTDLLFELMDKENISIFKFADDGTIKISAKDSKTCIETLNEVLQILHNWSKKHRMKINCDKNKTEVICFNTNEGDLSLIPETFDLGGKNISRVTETKVLGLIIDQKLTYQSHCQSIIKTLQGRWASLCKYSNKYWGFNIKVMVYLIKTLFISKMSYAGHIWITNDNLKDLNQLWYHILKSIIGAVLNISQRTAELILGLPPLQIQTQVNCIKHFLKIINTPVPQDVYKEFLITVYEPERKSPHLLHCKIKDTWCFLKWKLQNYTDKFNEEDKIIINSNNYSSMFNLSRSSCSYTQGMIKKYTETVLWSNYIKNQLQIEGFHTSPNPSCDLIPMPKSTQRKTEVQVLNLLYKNNILNQSLYNIDKKESPLCRYCKCEEETAEHLLFNCNAIDPQTKATASNSYKQALNLKDTDNEPLFEIGVLNAIRDDKFLKQCIHIVEQLDFDVTVVL